MAIIATILTINITNQAVNSANAQVAAGNTRVSSGNTQVAVIGLTLTPIPPQLTAVKQTIVAGSFMIESLNLSAEANSILRTGAGNAETAALLSIRVLSKLYLSSADAALVDASHRLKAVSQVFTYRGMVSSTAFSPDGTTFLIGISGDSDSGDLELRDTASGNLIWKVNIKSSGINGVAYSPDGKLVVAAAGDQTARILDALTGSSIRVISGHRDIVERAVFSPDGKTLLTLGGGSARTVRLWELETGRQIFSVPAGVGLTSLFFLPDGQTFYADDNLYNTSDGTPFQNSGIGGGTLALSPDGKTFVSGSRTTAELRSANTGQLIRSLSGHSDIVRSAAFSGDGKWLVTGSSDNTARVWEVASGKQVLLLSGNSAQVDSVAFSPDGTRVLTGSNTARLWNITGDNRQLIISALSEITVSALAPDGKSIVVGDESGNAGLWDLNTGKLLRNFQKDIHDVKSLAISPDGKMVALSIRHGNESVDVILVDAATGEILKTFTGAPTLQPYIGSLSFSSDGKMLLAGYFDNTARLWDVSSGQLLRLIYGSDSANGSGDATLSPDGQMIVFDGGRTWWNISTGARVNFPEAMSGNKIIFSPDGSLAAIIHGYTFSVWKVATQQLVQNYSGHSDQIRSLAFSPDNKMVLTGSADKTAMLWELSSARLLRVFTGHGASVTSVAFSPDGRTIITTSLDKTIRTWITDYNDLLVYACTLVGVDLTPEERTQYGVSDQEPTCPQFGLQSQPLLPTTTPLPTLTPFSTWTPISTPTRTPTP